MAGSRIALVLAAVATIVLGAGAAVAVAWPLPVDLGLAHRHVCVHRHSHHPRHCVKHRVTPAPTMHAPTPPAGVPVAPASPASSPALVSSLPVVTPPAAPETPVAGEPEPPVEPPSVPHVQVSAVEYAFTLSRTNVPAGKVVLQFVNDGQDEHNLKLEAEGGSLAGAFEKEPAKAVASQTLEMQPGQYTLFCSLPTHEQKGMKATLTVE
jgi:plastocyanin